MRLANLWLLVFLASLLGCRASHSHETQFQAASDFLFEHQSFQSDCAPPPSGLKVHFILGSSRPPFERKRAQTLTIPLSIVPALTLTADEANGIEINGSPRDSWLFDYCAHGSGNTESEAIAHLQDASIERIGGTVSLHRSATPNQVASTSTLLLTAPATAPVVVYASFAAVHVQNMQGPVRVTATHARATILDTTGNVDANGFVVDFAGSQGHVKLSSEMDINLKLRASRFNGSLMAWAQGPVRVLVPRSFETPFQALVSRPRDFSCRADICSKITLAKQGSLCIFTYPGDGKTPPSALHFRSELQTLVVDNGN